MRKVGILRRLTAVILLVFICFFFLEKYTRVDVFPLIEFLNWQQAMIIVAVLTLIIFPEIFGQKK